jgi:hypothetical protein
MVTWYGLQRTSVTDDGTELGLGPVDQFGDVYSLGDEVLLWLRHVVVARLTGWKINSNNHQCGNQYEMDKLWTGKVRQLLLEKDSQSGSAIYTKFSFGLPPTNKNC